MLFSVEFGLVMLGLSAIFLAITFFTALTLHLWSPGNRFGPEGRPYRYGTFKWCWEMGSKFAMTLVLIVLCAGTVLFLGNFFFVPMHIKLS